MCVRERECLCVNECRQKEGEICVRCAYIHTLIFPITLLTSIGRWPMYMYMYLQWVSTDWLGDLPTQLQNTQRRNYRDWGGLHALLIQDFVIHTLHFLQSKDKLFSNFTQLSSIK